MTMDRLSPGWKEHREAALQEAMRRSDWMAKATRSQIRAYVWKETQKRLKMVYGMTQDEFDEQVRLWTLKEETFRRMTAKTAEDAVVRTREAQFHFGESFPQINRNRVYDMVAGAFYRSVAKGLMFPVGNHRGFSHNPNLGAAPSFIDECRYRYDDLCQIELDAPNVYG